MNLFLKIKYFDRNDKKWKDRELYLNTECLDPIKKFEIEFLIENKLLNIDRTILKYRHLFTDKPKDYSPNGIFIGSCLCDYFENELGEEITGFHKEKHNIELPITPKSITPDEIKSFFYFIRDVKELTDSSFIMNASNSILVCTPQFKLKTAVNKEEIRSVLTIFRRLYLKKERAEFTKIASKFAELLDSLTLHKWIKGIIIKYENQLNSKINPKFIINQKFTINFNPKLLIDVFFYTQFHHQPCQKREEQYKKCLKEVNQNEDVLAYLFLTEILTISTYFENLWRIINPWFLTYCNQNQIKPDTIDSFGTQLHGIGTVEKNEDRSKRILDKKIKQLTKELQEN